jgi:hypothetical protein
MFRSADKLYVRRSYIMLQVILKLLNIKEIKDTRTCEQILKDERAARRLERYRATNFVF